MGFLKAVGPRSKCKSRLSSRKITQQKTQFFSSTQDDLSFFSVFCVLPMSTDLLRLCYEIFKEDLGNYIKFTNGIM
jgi:hypothetical protein